MKRPQLKMVPAAPMKSSAHFKKRLAEIRMDNYLKALAEWEANKYKRK